MSKSLYNNDDESLLLRNFNDREPNAFVSIYSLLYNDLYYFTKLLYQDTVVEPCDIIHDNFIKIWNLKSLQFETLQNIKGYMMISIKNGFKNYLTHKKIEEQYRQEIDDDYFVIKMAEMETFSILSEAINLLPEECARVFQLYVDGWSVKEIASKLNKSPNTVYTQKNDAIKLLKSKVSKKNFTILLNIMGY